MAHDLVTFNRLSFRHGLAIEALIAAGHRVKRYVDEAGEHFMRGEWDDMDEAHRKVSLALKLYDAAKARQTEAWSLIDRKN